MCHYNGTERNNSAVHCLFPYNIQIIMVHLNGTKENCGYSDYNGLLESTCSSILKFMIISTYIYIYIAETTIKHIRKSYNVYQIFTLIFENSKIQICIM